MQNHWLIVWPRENFAIYEKRGCHVVGFPRERSARQIDMSDILVFYIQKEQEIAGIALVTQSYFHDATPIWPNDVYPHRVGTEAIFKGAVDYKALRNHLELTDKGNKPPGAELRGGFKKISATDYTLIEKHFWTSTETPSVEESRQEGKQLRIEPEVSRSQPLPQVASRHEQLKKAMVEIGGRLGHYTKTENGPVYRHDVLWHENEYANPNHVIEVCEGGSLPKDFDALHWASDKWRAKGILVVTDDKDFAKAKSRFAGYTSVVVVKAETVEELHRVAQQNPDFLRLIFGK